MRYLFCAVLTGLLSGYPAWCAEPPPFPVSNAFSRGVQTVTGINFLVRHIAEHAIASQLQPQFQRRPKVKLRLYSAGDLAAGKFKRLTVTGRHLVMGVPFDTLTMTADSPVWLDLSSKPRLKTPVSARFEGTLTEAELNQMLSTQPTRIKVRLPALGEQTLLALNPKVTFKPNAIQLQTTLTVPGASLDTALPLVFEGQLQPSPDGRRLVWQNLKLSSMALQSPALVAQFVEQQLGSLLSFGSQQINGHPLKIKQLNSRLDGKQWLLSGDMDILPPKP